ncbi:response regulator [Sessilibacter sp. MAH2]
MKNNRSVDILLVEDNPGDVILTQEAFAEAKIVNSISIAKDGEEALNILFSRPGYEQHSKPDLILLDLNLPKVDGREVLENLKGDDVLRRIPVIVLTSSESERDILESYDLHANGYIVKPLDLNQFVNVVIALDNFWFDVVTLPPKID